MDGTLREEIRGAYDAVAEAYAERLPDASAEDALEGALLARLVERAGPGARLLDAGCGTGRMLGHLLGLEPSLDLVGVDLSEGMLRVARREHPGVPLIRGDLVDLPLADGELDAVLAWYSLIHLPDADLPAALTELRRVTRPGGVLLVGVQAGTGLRRLERPYGRDVRLTAFLHDTARVAADVVAAGFSLEAVLTRAPRATETHAQGFVLAAAR